MPGTPANTDALVSSIASRTAPAEKLGRNTAGTRDSRYASARTRPITWARGRAATVRSSRPGVTSGRRRANRSALSRALGAQGHALRAAGRPRGVQDGGHVRRLGRLGGERLGARRLDRRREARRGRGRGAGRRWPGRPAALSSAVGHPRRTAGPASPRPGRRPSRRGGRRGCSARTTATDVARPTPVRRRPAAARATTVSRSANVSVRLAARGPGAGAARAGCAAMPPGRRARGAGGDRAERPGGRSRHDRRVRRLARRADAAAHHDDPQRQQDRTTTTTEIVPCAAACGRPARQPSGLG